LVPMKTPRVKQGVEVTLKVPSAHEQVAPGRTILPWTNLCQQSIGARSA